MTRAFPHFLPRVARRGALIALAAVLLSPEAKALPKFAQKENKKCSFCHVKPAGGGHRNAAGRWYQTHGFTLAGFTGAKAAGAAKKQAARKPAPKRIKQKRKRP